MKSNHHGKGIKTYSNECLSKPKRLENANIKSYVAPNLLHKKVIDERAGCTSRFTGIIGLLPADLVQITKHVIFRYF